MMGETDPINRVTTNRPSKLILASTNFLQDQFTRRRFVERIEVQPRYTARCQFAALADRPIDADLELRGFVGLHRFQPRRQIGREDRAAQRGDPFDLREVRDGHDPRNERHRDSRPPVPFAEAEEVRVFKEELREDRVGPGGDFLRQPFRAQLVGRNAGILRGAEEDARPKFDPKLAEIGAQREAAFAARTLIVTVEEIVEELPPAMNAIVLPHWVVSAVAHCPGGAYPSYAFGYYKRDNAFYKAWDSIAKDRDSFRAWMKANVLEQGPEVFAAHARKMLQAAE